MFFIYFVVDVFDIFLLICFLAFSVVAVFFLICLVLFCSCCFCVHSVYSGNILDTALAFPPQKSSLGILFSLFLLRYFLFFFPIPTLSLQWWSVITSPGIFNILTTIPVLETENVTISTKLYLPNKNTDSEKKVVRNQWTHQEELVFSWSRLVVSLLLTCWYNGNDQSQLTWNFSSECTINHNLLQKVWGWCQNIEINH